MMKYDSHAVIDQKIDSAQYTKAEATLYGRFIKYTRFGAIMAVEMPTAPAEINVFIDMTQMMMPILRFDSIKNPLGLLATMVNLPLHYRNFFKKTGVKSNIFLIYSSNDSVNNYRYLESYDSSHKLLHEAHRETADVINHNIEMLKTLCPYLPGIYLKTGTVEPTVIAYDLIDKFTKGGSNVPNLFITSSDYAFQLPALMKNTILVYKKSQKVENGTNEDISFSVTSATALYMFIIMVKKNNIQIDKIQDLPAWISPIMILGGLQCRDVKMLFTTSQSLKILKYIKDNYSVITPDSIYEAMHDVLDKAVTIPKDEIYKRYYALDLDYQLKLYRELPESLETSFLNDLNDMQGLYDIANLYFNDVNTIDLSKL